MKITTLIENNADKEEKLKNEHGFSLFIETTKGNILFDTGQTGDFIDNAKKLNIDLSSINTIVLSHAHYDHCGGIKRLLEEYDIKPQIIISENFFKNSNKYRYLSEEINNVIYKEPAYKYIGIDFNEKYLKEKCIPIKYLKENMYKINDEVYVFTNFKKIHDFEKTNINMKIKINENEYVIDPFIDEISIGLKTREGIVILLGCAHPGFLNIVDSIAEYSNENIIGIIGGTHLKDADEERVNKSVEYVNSLNLKLLGLSHCTGNKVATIFSDKCQNTFKNRTGKILVI
ncbi:MAG: MBL fold metallo-hydrolase [Clostridium butyricum]|nr:MBL fold metallo-hydrolase [Clostridium butyricum]